MRKAIRHRGLGELKEWRRKFIAGGREHETEAECGENGIEQGYSGALFDLMAQFGSFSSMRSHAVACASLACRSRF